MCTVSFVKTGQKVIITSNRDEAVVRPSAIAPKNYVVNGKNIIFPKDPRAGGTWYAVGDKGTIVVLLNGANEKHIIGNSYRKSRGLIVLDVISADSPRDFWDDLDLDNIEPFTLVLFQNEALYQLRWDGVQKETVSLSANEKHIWSSATLYSDIVRQEREGLFNRFLEGKEQVSELDMYQFHRYADQDNHESGLVINLNDVLKTLSITQAVAEQNKVVLKHYDLIANQEETTSFIIV